MPRDSYPSLKVFNFFWLPCTVATALAMASMVALAVALVAALDVASMVALAVALVAALAVASVAVAALAAALNASSH